VSGDGAEPKPHAVELVLPHLLHAKALSRGRRSRRSTNPRHHQSQVMRESGGMGSVVSSSTATAARLRARFTPLARSYVTRLLFLTRSLQPSDGWTTWPTWS
jgi:hypothetical protein